MNMESLSRSQVIQLANKTGNVSGYDLSGLNLTYLDLYTMIYIPFGDELCIQNNK